MISSRRAVITPSQTCGQHQHLNGGLISCWRKSRQTSSVKAALSTGASGQAPSAHTSKCHRFTKESESSAHQTSAIVSTPVGEIVPSSCLARVTRSLVYWDEGVVPPRQVLFSPRHFHAHLDPARKSLTLDRVRGSWIAPPRCR